MKYKDDMDYFFKLLLQKCDMCHNWNGIKNDCKSCKKCWHYECLFFDDICLDCQKEHNIQSEIKEIPDMSIINTSFNVIHEVNQSSSYLLQLLFNDLNFTLCDDLINNSPSNSDGLFFLIPVGDTIDSINTVKKYTSQFLYNGLQVVKHHFDYYCLKSSVFIPKNTLLGEVSGEVTKTKTNFCLKYGENFDDMLYIDTEKYCNVFGFMLFTIEEDYNVSVCSYYWDKQYHLLVFSIKDININDILKYNLSE